MLRILKFSYLSHFCYILHISQVLPTRCTPVVPVRLTSCMPLEQSHSKGLHHMCKATDLTCPFLSPHCRCSAPHPTRQPSSSPSPLLPPSPPSPSHPLQSPFRSHCGRLPPRTTRSQGMRVATCMRYSSEISAGLAPNIWPTKDCKNPHGGLAPDTPSPHMYLHTHVSSHLRVFGYVVLLMTVPVWCHVRYFSTAGGQAVSRHATPPAS